VDSIAGIKVGGLIMLRRRKTCPMSVAHDNGFLPGLGPTGDLAFDDPSFFIFLSRAGGVVKPHGLEMDPEVADKKAPHFPKPVIEPIPLVPVDQKKLRFTLLIFQAQSFMGCQPIEQRDIPLIVTVIKPMQKTPPDPLILPFYVMVPEDQRKTPFSMHLSHDLKYGLMSFVDIPKPLVFPQLIPISQFYVMKTVF